MSNAFACLVEAVLFWLLAKMARGNPQIGPREAGPRATIRHWRRDQNHLIPS